jgi:TPR repeat protein
MILRSGASRARHRGVAIALLALALAVPASGSAAGPADFDRAAAFWRAGQYGQAVALARPLAERNHAQSMMLMCDAYLNGRGVRKQPERCPPLLEKVAGVEQDGAAKLFLGYAYLNAAMGLPRDLEKAKHYLEASAAQGNQKAAVMAQNELKQALSQPSVAAAPVAPPSPAPADASSPERASPFRTANELFREGRFQEAIDTIEPVAREGNTNAQVLLERLRVHQQSSPQAVAQALDALKRMAEQRNGYAAHSLGRFLLERDTPWLSESVAKLDIPGRSNQEALKWLAAAAMAPHRDAFEDLAKLRPDLDMRVLQPLADKCKVEAGQSMGHKQSHGAIFSNAYEKCIERAQAGIKDKVARIATSVATGIERAELGSMRTGQSFSGLLKKLPSQLCKPTDKGQSCEWSPNPVPSRDCGPGFEQAGRVRPEPVTTTGMLGMLDAFNNRMAAENLAREAQKAAYEECTRGFRRTSRYYLSRMTFADQALARLNMVADGDRIGRIEMVIAEDAGEVRRALTRQHGTPKIEIERKVRRESRVEVLPGPTGQPEPETVWYDVEYKYEHLYWKSKGMTVHMADRYLEMY